MIEPRYQSERVTLHHGGVLDVLRAMPDESVHCVVTSPPYWGLRDYGTAEWEGGDGSECDHLAPRKGGTGPASAVQTKVKRVDFESGGQYAHTCPKCGARRIDSQLGLEATPEEFVAKMVEVFREVRRVLRSDGTCWVNLGDSYASSGGERAYGSSDGGTGRGPGTRRHDVPASGLKPKDLCGIPWRVALALQADGWWLRSDIIWSKPNPMPESCTDRPTKAHEYLFLLTKRATYFYDADAVREAATYGRDIDPDKFNGVGSADRNPAARGISSSFPDPSAGRNRRTVWTIPTESFAEAHFATYPRKLVQPCIAAGTSDKGCCPECGAPWRRVVEKERVATRPGRNNKTMQEVPRGWAVGERSHATADNMTEAGGKRRRADLEIGNRDEYRHVTTSRTIGWEPGCECKIHRLRDDVPEPIMAEIENDLREIGHETQVPGMRQ